MVIKVTVRILPSTEVYMFYDNQSLVLTSGNLHHRPSILLLLRTILQRIKNNLNPQCIKKMYTLRKTVHGNDHIQKNEKEQRRQHSKFNIRPVSMLNERPIYYKHDKLLIISYPLIFIFFLKFVVLTTLYNLFNIQFMLKALKMHFLIN